MLAQQISDNINPSNPLDWGVLAVIIVSVVASVGTGAKKTIEWVVGRITAPDTRVSELEKEKAVRETEDRKRFVKLEHDVETLRAELIKMHLELKLSEVARARTEGELEALKRQIDKNTLSRENPVVKKEE